MKRPAKDKFVVMIGPHYSSRGGMASVIASYKDAGLFDTWPVIFLPTHKEGSKLRKLLVALSSMLRFVALLSARKVAVLHVHAAVQRSFLRKAIFMSLALVAHVPYLFHLHAGKFPDFYWKGCGPTGRRIIRFYLDRAACLIVLSTHWKAFMAEITNNTHIEVVPNFVISPDGSLTDRREPDTLLFIGHLTKEKGFFDLMESMSLLKDRFPSAHLEVGGDGDPGPVMEKAAALHIEDRIKLHGWVSGSVKEELLRRASMFVLPSYFEGLPVCVLEAMSHGLAVVTTDVGGIPDVITSGQNGILVRAGDISGLADAIGSLLSRPGEKERIGASALETIMSRFHPETVLPKLRALYEGFGIRPPASEKD